MRSVAGASAVIPDLGVIGSRLLFGARQPPFGLCPRQTSFVFTYRGALLDQDYVVLSVKRGFRNRHNVTVREIAGLFAF